MQGTSFVVLTGHLNDYPLPSLIGILRRQRKTGRLLIEYPGAPCSLYFENGELVDAQLNQLQGLQAVYVALSQPGASFNFNPLIQPPRRSIDGSAQQVLLESLGCWEEKAIKVQPTAAKDDPPPLESEESEPAAQALPVVRKEELPVAKQLLALPPASADQRTVLKREVFTASAILLSLLSLLAVMTLMGWLNKGGAHSIRAQNVESAPPPEDVVDLSGRAIEVVVRIENGRVSQAYILDPQAGLESYEALALRIARGRRYPPGTRGQETVLIEIKAPR